MPLSWGKLLLAARVPPAAADRPSGGGLTVLPAMRGRCREPREGAVQGQTLCPPPWRLWGSVGLSLAPRHLKGGIPNLIRRRRRWPAPASLSGRAGASGRESSALRCAALAPQWRSRVLQRALALASPTGQCCMTQRTWPRNLKHQRHSRPPPPPPLCLLSQMGL